MAATTAPPPYLHRSGEAAGKTCLLRLWHGAERGWKLFSSHCGRGWRVGWGRGREGAFPREPFQDGLCKCCPEAMY